MEEESDKPTDAEARGCLIFFGIALIGAGAWYLVGFGAGALFVGISLLAIGLLVGIRK